MRTGLPFVSVSLLLLGCINPALHLVKTDTTPLRPREQNCVYSISASHPGPNFKEIGYLENIAYDETSVLKKVFGKTICEAGTDHVVTEVNGSGMIVRAVLFRKVDG